MGLDTVDLLYTIEKHFGISIPDQVAETILTVGDYQRMVWEYLHRDPSRRQVTREAVDAEIVHLIAKFAGLPISTVTPDKRITDDLGLD